MEKLLGNNFPGVRWGSWKGIYLFRRSYKCAHYANILGNSQIFIKLVPSFKYCTFCPYSLLVSCGSYFFDSDPWNSAVNSLELDSCNPWNLTSHSFRLTCSLPTNPVLARCSRRKRLEFSALCLASSVWLNVKCLWLADFVVQCHRLRKWCLYWEPPGAPVDIALVLCCCVCKVRRYV